MAEPSDSTTIPNDIVTMSFETALAELEDIVRQLEQGEGALEQSIEAYARGAALKKHCEAKLKEAQLKVDKITFREDGGAETEPA